MNFSGVSLDSLEIRVCEPKVDGDIQNDHNMSSTLHILSTGKYKHHMKIDEQFFNFLRGKP